MKRFAGKAALITGGAGVLGRGCALRLAAEGAGVVIADLHEGGAQAVAAEIGGEAIAVRADVTSPEDCQAMVLAALERFGRLDVVFANAGVGGEKVEFLHMPMEEWDRVMGVNLRGLALTCKAAVPAMIDAGGSIVLMGSSTGGWDSILGAGPYMTSKEAVKAMARNLALELARYRIRVNAVCPGIIETPLSFRQASDDPAAWERFFARFAERIPLRRVGQPEDVAATVAFLASDDARHITGASLLIDGGQTLQSWSNAPDGAYPSE
ncbi:MAG: SDR family NAD(P)-dependent oxidoreductase [Chloroflexota bacterium]|nr:SDR family NAD(P)-dependent oxidoreductase [Chloroflexota bacterium]MDE2947840.1 SDR family NAD(P)-dependent oxidoreductase [Chloroflexota bacterium]